MPPRFAYWTIILEGKPTAFRAHERDDLLPTLRQLQTKHPDVALMWFARGKLWASPAEERERSRHAAPPRRDREWRPGGEHRDPRARFEIPRDEKRRRFAAKLRRDRRTEGRLDRPGGRDERGRPPWARSEGPERPASPPREATKAERPDRQPGGARRGRPQGSGTGWPRRPPGPAREGQKPEGRPGKTGPPRGPAHRRGPRPPRNRRGGGGQGGPAR